MPAAEGPAAAETGWGTAREDMLPLNVIGISAVAAYGIVVWDWGDTGFAFRSEGWFGEDTPYGGADKLGHAYAGAAITAGASAWARSKGADNEHALLLGGLTAAMWTTAVEIGDGFSGEYGFSPEDQVADLVGIGFEMLRQSSPWLAARVQYRWEWVPSPLFLSGENGDPFSDYSGSRYILAFPMAPWLEERSPLRYVELLAGYGTTGFDDANQTYYDSHERNPFIGIGLHIGAVLDSSGVSRPGRLLEYVQVPYTAYPWQQRP